jgi:hypothetical protein
MINKIYLKNDQINKSKKKYIETSSKHAMINTKFYI